MQNNSGETKTTGFRASVSADFLVWSRVGGWRPSTSAFIRLLAFQPGFQLITCIRIQGLVRGIPVLGKLLHRVMWYFTTIWFSTEISPDAHIGPGAYFPHPPGIVIGGKAVIGANVSIYQGVTVGRADSRDHKVPIIMDNVKVYAGAKVLGSITVGRGSVIGANAVVLRDVPEGHAAVGVPARIMPLKPTPQMSG